ncbi:MAG TPA: VWA domain-containing protein [Mucilaginibacter sp.]|nr:VWA domain-containing protein [Mucilaginibacter sp.]
MIYFEHSNYLYGLGILLPLVAMWLINRRRQLKALASLGDSRLVKNLVITSPLSIQLTRYALFLLGFSLLIIAAAKPYIMNVDEHARSTSPTDIVFVVDVSKSMYAKDMAPDRLSRAKHLIKEIIGKLNGERVGIVLFAGKASTYAPLTGDYYYLDKLVDNISGDWVSQHGTSLREALKISALIYDQDSKKNKIMCLVTDGEFHDNAIILADSLRKSGIKLFSFGFGTMKGAAVPVNYKPDNEEVEKDRNGHEVISRLHSAELLKIGGNEAKNYFQVADQLNAASLFTARLKAVEDKNISTAPKQYYPLFLMGAIILLIAEICIPQVIKTYKLS